MNEIDGKDIYVKQSKLYNPNQQNPKVFIYGAGSIGSHVTMGLAKIGISDITIYDYDTVELTNVPAQFFSVEQAQEEKTKTESIKSLVEYMTGIQIKTENLKIDDDFQPTPTINSIHILAIDNIEIRKLLALKLKGFPVHIIDGRIGGFNYDKYYLQAEDDDTFTEYLSSLEGEFSEEECGTKCLWALNSLVASKITTDIIKLTQGKQPSPFLRGNLLTEMVIEKKPKSKVTQNAIHM